MENKFFWQIVKPFLTDKNSITNQAIMLNQQASIVTDEKEIATIFNEHYINIVETTTGIKPLALNEKEVDTQIFQILKKYENHPSILEIRKQSILANKDNPQVFSFKEVNETEILKLIKEMKIDTSTGMDKIPPKLIKLAAPYLVKPLTNAINSSIEKKIFPKSAKIASVTPLDKGGKDKT